MDKIHTINPELLSSQQEEGTTRGDIRFYVTRNKTGQATLRGKEKPTDSSQQEEVN